MVMILSVIFFLVPKFLYNKIPCFEQNFLFSIAIKNTYNR